MALLTISITNAQKHINVALYKDAKLLFVGDPDRGYKAGTINALARLELQGIQQKHGFISSFLEVEYAQLKHGFLRYSLNFGYTFNQLPVKKLEAGVSAGYGIIDRNQRSYLGFTGNTFLTYPISQKVKFCLLAQVTDRKDISKKVYSGFFGFKYILR